MIGKGCQPTLSMVPKSSIITDFPLEKYIPPNLARREKLKAKGKREGREGRKEEGREGRERGGEGEREGRSFHSNPHES